MVDVVSVRPPLVLCLSDYDTLERAALAILLEAPRVAGALLEEIDRAAVVADDDLRPDAVRLGSWVEFTDSAAGGVRRVRLVETSPSATAAHELSVLTVEGAALVGLREGHTIVWPDRLGAHRLLKVVRTWSGRPH